MYILCAWLKYGGSNHSLHETISGAKERAQELVGYPLEREWVREWMDDYGDGASAETVTDSFTIQKLT